MVVSFLIFLFGAIIGSFLNVVILRYGNRFFAKSRSECFSCGHVLEFFDLIPLFSFVFLRGRCRYCKSKISSQYFLVELSTAAIFLFVYLKAGFHLEFIFFMVIWALLITIFVYDLRHKIIPDALVYTLVLVAFGYMLISNFPSITLEMFLSGPIIASPFAFLWLVSKGRWMGFGDAKLGLALGWFLGLAEGFSAILLAFWIGALVGLILIFLSKIKNIGLSPQFKSLTIKSEIPFAPFLIIGTFVVFFLEPNLFKLFLFNV